MLRRTRRRLTAAMTLLTGAVLAAALSIGAVLTCRSQIQASESYFLSQLQSLSDRLATGRMQDSWLRDFELQNTLCVRILDNGRPLFFKGGYRTGRQRADLFAWADDALSQTAGSLQEIVHNLDWRAAQTSVRLENSLCVITAVQDLSSLRADLTATALGYCLLFAGGFLSLGAISWFLSGRMLRPVQRAMKSQADFVAAAGHELKTPAAAVSACLSAMGEHPAAAEEYRQAAQNEALRLARLVDDLLVLANADAAHWKWRPQPLDADALMIDAAEQWRELARKRGFALCLQLPDAPLPALEGDRDRLLQILAALIDNATAYAPPSTRITLSARPVSNALLIEVSDQGPGVPDADKERIFDRFARLDPSRTGKNHCGLGLAVARELASLHHGTLTCTDAPGGGARFVLKLPIARQSPSEVPHGSG